MKRTTDDAVTGNSFLYFVASCETQAEQHEKNGITCSGIPAGDN